MGLGWAMGTGPSSPRSSTAPHPEPPVPIRDKPAHTTLAQLHNEEKYIRKTHAIFNKKKQKTTERKRNRHRKGFKKQNRKNASLETQAYQHIQCIVFH